MTPATKATALVATIGLFSGCAGAMPLLAEPRLGPVGDVQAQIGGVAMAPLGDARSYVTSTLAPTVSGTLGRGALDAAASQVAMPAGVAPFVRASATVDARTQLSVRGSTREAGVGGRYMIVDDRTDQGGATTLSLGFDAVHAFGSGIDGDTYDGVQMQQAQVTTIGIPLIFSWQSSDGLVLAYAGATLGGGLGALDVAAANDAQHVSFERLFGSITGGLGVGFGAVHVLAELGVERDAIFSHVGGDDVSRGVWSLVPGFALSVHL
jgi:hypothetical protein